LSIVGLARSYIASVFSVSKTLACADGHYILCRSWTRDRLRSTVAAVSRSKDKKHLLIAGIIRIYIAYKSVIDLCGQVVEAAIESTATPAVAGYSRPPTIGNRHHLLIGHVCEDAGVVKHFRDAQTREGRYSKTIAVA